MQGVTVWRSIRNACCVARSVVGWPVYKSTASVAIPRWDSRAVSQNRKLQTIEADREEPPNTVNRLTVIRR